MLSAGPPRIWGHQARCILVLRARYATADLDAALAHAARFGALEHRVVERILEARSSPRTLDEYVAEDTARRLEQALGERRLPSRDLTAYDRLPSRARRDRPLSRRPQSPLRSHVHVQAKRNARRRRHRR